MGNPLPAIVAVNKYAPVKMQSSNRLSAQERVLCYSRIDGVLDVLYGYGHSYTLSRAHFKAKAALSARR